MNEEVRRITAPEIKARKGGEPIVALTSYHAHTAALIDRYVDVILVGDSLGMVMHGLETTVPVTLDMMILQGRADARLQTRSWSSTSFGSYESREQAFRNCARVLKETHWYAVKLEGGVRMADTIRFLAERGVPVMATSDSRRRAITRSARSAPAAARANGTDRRRRQGRRRGRRVFHGDRSGGRAVGAQDDRRGRNPDHRHRRITGLRWPGAGARGHASGCRRACRAS
jgi:hypothetical protein